MARAQAEGKQPFATGARRQQTQTPRFTGFSATMQGARRIFAERKAIMPRERVGVGQNPAPLGPSAQRTGIEEGHES